MATVTHLDPLLAHYLSLLHTYTTLRAEINTLTSQLHSHLARANFLSSRGRHYGQVDYDERMRANLRLKCRTKSESDIANGEKVEFEIGDWDCDSDCFSDGKGEQSPQEQKTEDGEKERDISGGTKEEVEAAEGRGEAESDSGLKPAAQRTNAALRQFATLPPPSLRQAQGTAEQLIRKLVPKLADVDAEMRHVEIEVRRARKRARKLQVGTLEKEQKTVREEKLDRVKKRQEDVNNM